MKALGSFVTFVRRSLSAVVIFKNTYFDINAWSRMFAVNVQSVSSQQVNWRLISWYTRTLKVLAAFYVIKVSSVSKAFLSTLRDVLLSWVTVTCYQYVSNCLHNSSCVVCHFFWGFHFRNFKACHAGVCSCMAVSFVETDYYYSGASIPPNLGTKLGACPLFP